MFFFRHIFEMTPEDAVLLASPYTFDPSIVQMFLALSCGAVLVIVPDALKMMPTKLCNVIFKRQKITILQVSGTFLLNLYIILINHFVERNSWFHQYFDHREDFTTAYKILINIPHISKIKKVIYIFQICL